MICGSHEASTYLSWAGPFSTPVTHDVRGMKVLRPGDNVHDIFSKVTSGTDRQRQTILTVTIPLGRGGLGVRIRLFLSI